MTVLIENLQKMIAVTDNINGLLNRAVELSLAVEEFDRPSEISFLLVDNDTIKEINREHRNIDKATDVLSFPMADVVHGEIQSEVGDFDMDEELLLLGDIVISMEMAEKQAEEYGHSFDRELAFLATHGIFHLLGYDHMEPNEEKRMFEKQDMVLTRMGLPRAL